MSESRQGLDVADGEATAHGVRLARLVREVLAGMAKAATRPELATVLLDGVASLGFAHSALWLVEGDELVLLDTRGGDEPVQAIACLSLDARASPLVQSVVLERALWPADLAAQSDRGHGSSSLRAVLPLLASSGAMGVLALLDDREREVEPELRTILDELSVVCASALARALTAEQVEERLREEQLLLGVTSHDLRSPLHLIALGSELLEARGRLDSADLQLIRQVRASARRGIQLVERLLDFSKVRLSGADARLSQGDLFELLRTVVEDFRVRSPDCPLELAVEGDGEALLDREMVSQILHNLLANAAQYREPGTTVRVRGQGLRDRVYLEINNRGAAISQQELNDLFAPLKRGRAAGEKGSLGLGLHIVQRLVRAHGGSVWARSCEREGTTFVVQLPRGVYDAGTVAPAQPRLAPAVDVPEAYRRLLTALAGQPHAALLEHWLTIGGATHLPHPRQLDRGLVSTLLPDLFRVEVLRERSGARRFRFQEVGPALERRLRGRALDGAFVAQAESPIENALAQAYERCVEGRRPVYDYARSGPSRAEEESFRRIVLPFSSDGEQVTHLVGLATFAGFDEASGDELDDPLIVDPVRRLPLRGRSLEGS